MFLSIELVKAELAEIARANVQPNISRCFIIPVFFNTILFFVENRIYSIAPNFRSFSIVFWASAVSPSSR
jgi:hypothetical protein